MATIPMGNFGNVMPQAPQGRVLDSGAGQVAQAVQNLGQVGMQVSAKKLNEQQKIQDDKEEYDFAVLTARYGAEYGDINATILDKVKSGQVKHADAETELKNNTSRLFEQYQQELPETKRERFKAFTDQSYYKATGPIKQIADQASDNEYRAKFNIAFENLLKTPDRKQAEANLDLLLSKSYHLTNSEKIDLKYKFQNRRDGTDFDYLFNSSQHDNEKLAKLLDNIDIVTKSSTAEQKLARKDKIYDRIDYNKKLEYEAVKKRERELEADIKEFASLVYTGKPPEADYLQSIKDKAKGTKWEAVINRDLEVNKFMQGFSKLSIAEQEKKVSDMEAQAFNSPVDPESASTKIISASRSLLNQNKSLAKENTPAYIKKTTGLDVYTPTVQEIITGNFDVKKAEVTIKTMAEFKKRNGAGTLNPLTDTEQIALKKAYTEGDPQTKATIIRNLDILTASNNDAKKEVLTSIHGEKRYLPYMAVSYLQKHKIRLVDTSVNNGRYASEVILEGFEMMDKGLAKGVSPSFKEFENMFNSMKPTALVSGTQKYQAMKDLTLAAYLSLQKDKAGIEYDSKGRIKDSDKEGLPPLDEETFKQAFGLATGGTYVQKVGRNENKIARPYGIDTQTMTEQFQSGIRDAHNKAKINVPRSFLNIYSVTPTNRPYTYQFSLNGKPYEIGDRALEVTLKPK